MGAKNRGARHVNRDSLKISRPDAQIDTENRQGMRTALAADIRDSTYFDRADWWHTRIRGRGAIGLEPGSEAKKTPGAGT